jgi:glutamate-1-semialdehyde 2,1-aminomutase
MRAGLAALEQLEQPGFYEKLEEKTTSLVEALRQMMHDNKITGCVNQLGSMFTPFFGASKVRKKTILDQPLYCKFFKQLFQQGIYMAPSPYEANFVSSAHTEEQLEKTRKACLALSF